METVTSVPNFDFSAMMKAMMEQPPPLEQICATLLIGIALILILTGRFVSTVSYILSWVITTVHSALLAMFTALNVIWISYVVLITCVTKEIDYSAKDWVYFNGPTALAMVAFPSAIYLNVVRWKKDKDGWVWASMALAWVVTFLATWIGYTLVVFSLGAVDCPYDLRNMVTLVRSFK